MGSVFGKTMTEIGEALFPTLSPDERMNLLDICFAYENTHLEDHPGMAYPGVVETIKMLAEKYPLFIVSNCQIGYVEITMKSLGIESYIKDHLCFGETLVPKSEDDPHINGKKRSEGSCLYRRHPGRRRCMCRGGGSLHFRGIRSR